MGESSKYLYQLGMGETKGAGPTNGCWFSRFYTNNFDPFPTASGFLSDSHGLAVGMLATEAKESTFE